MLGPRFAVFRRYGQARALPVANRRRVTIIADDDLGAEGHAVAADVETTIRQWKVREKFRDDASAVRGRIIILQAGHEAGGQVLGSATGNDEDDRECAVALIEDAGTPEGCDAEVLQRFCRAARPLVRRHRANIELAAAFLKHETLTGDEVDAMLPPGSMARPITWALAPVGLGGAPAGRAP